MCFQTDEINVFPESFCTFQKSDTEKFREDMMTGFSIAFFGEECIRFYIE